MSEVNETVVESIPATIKLEPGVRCPHALDSNKELEGVLIYPCDLKLRSDNDKWINRRDTAVFYIRTVGFPVARFVNAIAAMKPDQCDYIETDKGVIFRLWWD